MLQLIHFYKHFYILEFQYKTLSILTEIRDILLNKIEDKEISNSTEFKICDTDEDLKAFGELLDDDSHKRDIVNIISRFFSTFSSPCRV